jgi:hypothetical protein
MEHFLAEVLDSTNHRNVTETVKSFLDSKTGTLSYALIFACPVIVNSLLYCWMFRECFGIWPSKLDIQTDSDEFDVIARYIFQNTYYRFISEPNTFTEYIAHKRTLFDAYKTSLSRNDVTKEQLYQKLKDRVCTYPCQQLYAYDVTLTLYQLYCRLVPDSFTFYRDERNAIQGNKLHTINVVTGFTTANQKDIDSFFTCTQSDAIKHVFNKDNYFTRMLFNQKLLVSIVPKAFRSFGGISDGFAPSVTLTNAAIPIDRKQPSAIVWVCDRLPDILHCVPKLASQSIITGAYGYGCNFSRDPAHHMDLQIPTSLSDHGTSALLASDEIFDAYTKCAVTERYSNHTNSGAPLPLYVLTFLLDYIRKKKCENIIENSVKSKASNTLCLFLVDNRPNIHSVVSLIVSLYNIHNQDADIVVMTSSGSVPFYARYFPSAKIITSNAIMNKNGKFNIEQDVNNVMKDASTWRALKDMGYTRCITIQDDGFLIRQGVEQFLHYDYVGAPWLPIPVLVDAGVSSHMVGNGGLSLRNVALMLDITSADTTCKHTLFNNNLQVIPEDVYFSIEVQKQKGRIPDTATASRFAMEQIYDTNSVGMHKPWAYLGTSEIRLYLYASL